MSGKFPFLAPRVSMLSSRWPNERANRDASANVEVELGSEGATAIPGRACGWMREPQNLLHRLALLHRVPFGEPYLSSPDRDVTLLLYKSHRLPVSFCRGAGRESRLIGVMPSVTGS